MQRIIITGNAGSGKSTLARQLGKIMSVPVIHADTYLFIEGEAWKVRPIDDFHADILEAIAQDSWIFESGDIGAFQQSCERCEAIIYIDFNRFFCLYRVIKRRVQIKKKPRTEMPKGCIDRLERKFVKGVFWDYYKSRRPRLLHVIEASGKQVYHLKSRKQAREFAKMVKAKHL